MPTYSASALAKLPHTSDGEQLLIYPWQDPEERRDILNSMAADGARAPQVQAIVRGVLAWLPRRLGRAPTTLEIAQGLLDAVYGLVDYWPDQASERDFYQPVQVTLRPSPEAPMSPITCRRKGKGDCEDTSVLFAAMALAVPLVSGIPMGAHVQWLDQPGDPQNHVAASVTLPSGELWVETTLPGARIGEHPYDALKRLGNTHASRLTGTR